MPRAAANQGAARPGRARRRAGGGWRGGGAGAVPVSLRAAGPGCPTMWFGGSVPAAIAAAKERSSVFVVFVAGTVRPGAARCPHRQGPAAPSQLCPARRPSRRAGFVLCQPQPAVSVSGPRPSALWSGIARPMCRLPSVLLLCTGFSPVQLSGLLVVFCFLSPYRHCVFHNTVIGTCRNSHRLVYAAFLYEKKCWERGTQS